MNWSKAKTILIIVFLIADIFLFYELYPSAIQSRNAIDDEKVQEVMEYLGNKGVFVNCTIPKASRPKKPLSVKYKSFDSQFALEKFFQNPQDISIHQYEDKTIIEDEEIYLEINKIGELTYKNKQLMGNQSETIDDEMALSNIEEFLKIIGIMNKDIYDCTKIKENGYLKMHCSQGYKGNFLDHSYLEINATNDGVAFMKMLWFEIEDNEKNKNDIIHPLRALIELPGLYEDYDGNIIVNDISLGYYFNTDMEEVREFDMTEVKEGKAVPVWRINANVGKIYINAYNGTVEKKQKIVQNISSMV